MGRLWTRSAADTAAAIAIAFASTVAVGSWRVSGWAHRQIEEAQRNTPVTAVTLTNSEAPAPQPKASAGSETLRPARTYNVILITVDTLRADLGFMGYPRKITPNIDALASKSMIFENAYAMASFTPKCLGPLMIGRYASETHRDYQHYTNFGSANVFLAERVHDRGYRTIGAPSHRYFGWKKGFERGMDVWDTSAIPQPSVDNDPRPTSDKLSNIAIKLLMDPKGSKSNFFAWFHYIDPHLPYTATEGTPTFEAVPGIPKERHSYDREVWFTDKHIGRLLDHIASQPWANDTAIIFTADHGEAFGERGHWGHGRELWQPLVHVPLLIHVPGMDPKRIKTKRSHVDLVPTVIDLMGLAPDETLHGKSLVGDTTTEHDIYIDMPDGPYNELRRSVITGPAPGTKLIEFKGTRYEIYDLAKDPDEKKNLAGDTALLQSMKDTLARVRSTVKEIPVKKQP